MAKTSLQRQLRSLLVASCALGALLTVACSGTSSSSGFDPKRAGELAHQSLLTETDLPGAGWRVTDNDHFTPDAALQALPSGCDEMKSLLLDAGKGLAGRAERGFEKPALTTLVGTIVNVEVYAYEKSDGVAPLVERYRQQASDGSLVKCLGQRSGRATSVTSSSPTAKPPANGGAVALERQFTGQSGQTMTRRDEQYVWATGNVVVSIDVSGPADRFMADVVNVAIQKTQAAVEKAAKSK